MVHQSRVEEFNAATTPVVQLMQSVWISSTFKTTSGRIGLRHRLIIPILLAFTIKNTEETLARLQMKSRSMVAEIVQQQHLSLGHFDTEKTEKAIICR